MNRDLNTFESDLLTELRGVVATRALAEPQTTRTPTRSPRRRRAGLVSLGGLATLAVATVGIVHVTSEPAFAVSTTASGAVTVEVNRPEGAAALEQALADEGVTAVVQYLEPGKMCEPGWIDEVTEDRRGIVGSFSLDKIEVEIQPGYLEAGETFVLATSAEPTEGGFSGWVLMTAASQVRECVVVDYDEERNFG